MSTPQIVLLSLGVYFLAGLTLLPKFYRVAKDTMADPPPGEYYPTWYLPLMLAITVIAWPVVAVIILFAHRRQE